MPQSKEPEATKPTSESFVFPPERRAEALLAAWLTDSIALTDSELGAGADASTLRIVSRIELKTHIERAFEKGDQKTADSLLALAASTQGPSSEMVRKSIRMGPGEYLSLYRLKLRKGASFSDIITEVSTPRILSFLRERIDPGIGVVTGGGGVAKKRFEHIVAELRSWSQKKPESRTKEPDWEADLPGMIAKYPYRVDEVKEAYLGMVFRELDDKMQHMEYNYPEGKDNIYQHFRAIWKRDIEEDVVASTFLESSLGDKGNTIHFTPVVSPNGRVRFEDKELEDLFDAYGEQEVRSFANTMDEISGTPEKFKQTDRESRVVYFRMEVKLPVFAVRETGPDQFEVECIEKKAFAQKLAWDAAALEEAVKQEALRLEQNPNSYFKQEYDEYYGRETGEGRVRKSLGEILATSDNLTRLIRLATKLASAPEDFAEVQRLTRMRTRVRGYSMVLEFLESLVRSSVENHNVISFYVNADVWRAMPLALQGTNWIELTSSLSH